MDGSHHHSAEILGVVHYLRELCGAQEGQLWREQMKEIVKNEGSTAVRRAKLVNSFNDGYRGYRRTYRTCTARPRSPLPAFRRRARRSPRRSPSRRITQAEVQRLTRRRRQPPPDAAPAPATGNAPAASGGAAPTTEAKPADATKPAANQTEATPGTQASQGEAAATEANPVDGAEKPKRKKRKAAKAKPAEPGPSIPFSAAAVSHLGQARREATQARLTVSSPFSPLPRASVPVFGLSTRVAKNRGIPRCSLSSV